VEPLFGISNIFLVDTDALGLKTTLGGPLPSEVFVFIEWHTVYLPEGCVRRTHCHWLIEGTVRMGETVNK